MRDIGEVQDPQILRDAMIESFPPVITADFEFGDSGLECQTQKHK